MHYVKQFHINGVDTKQVACIELHGKPNAATEGAVGVLGIDMDSPLHDVYKCIGVNGSIYSWELLSSGLSIMSSTISGGGTESVQFPYANLLTPAMYVVKIGDLILDSEGYLYQIKALNTTYCDAKYTGTQVAAYGHSAYDLAVKNGFEGSEEEWIASLKGKQGDQGIQGIQGVPGNTPYIGDNGTWWIAGIDTGVNADKGTQMESGWYNGTGTTDNVTLTFSFVPKIILFFIHVTVKDGSYNKGRTGIAVIIPYSGARIGYLYQSYEKKFSDISTTVTFEGTTVTLSDMNIQSIGYINGSWVTATEESGNGYHYVAFG